MAILSEEAKMLIKDVHPGFIATASLTGRPNVSPKGSFRVLDDEHVLFADVHSPNTIANLIENPQVAAFVFEPSTRHGCRIWGSAEVISSGDLFDQVNAELSGRNMRANHIVVVSVAEFIVF
jgi:predicted pyridoxine 5'-phosphate oxidase superfamily flavin-nucleotide-binding protein